MSSKESLFPVSESQSVPNRAMTRRQVLRALGAGSVALVGGGVLSACGGGSTTSGVTLYSADYPFNSMPTKDDQAKNPTLKSYAQSLQRWFDKNPGVTIKESAANIWDQQALTTAVSAGTAPTWMPGNVLGGWAYDTILAAFARGLAADTTALVEQYGLNDKLAAYVRPLWSKWKVNDKYYGVPESFHAGYGLYYRRDLVKEAGLKEPEFTWKWEDLHTLAKGLTKDKRAGAAFNWHGINRILSANQFDLLTNLPAPQNAWPWRYDFGAKMSEWTRLVEFYRTMALKEKVIASNSNPAYGDADVAKVFARGDAAMFMADTNFFTRLASDPLSILQLADSLKKPIDEVAGFVPIPQGTHGTLGDTQPYLGSVAFNPRLNRDQAALDKAFSLYEYMKFGQGYIDQKVATYEQTKDLKMVFDTVTPINGMLTINGIPGSATEAWGTQYMKSIEMALKIPMIPLKTWFLPPEQNQQPTTDAQTDSQTALAFSERSVSEILTNQQQVMNQQLDSLSSSIAKEEFLKGIKVYYTAIADFWKQHAPEFYTTMFVPLYEQKILPSLK